MQWSVAACMDTPVAYPSVTTIVEVDPFRRMYAPLVALAIGFGCYYVWGAVSNLREQTVLLAERNIQLELLLANQCTTILEQQGFTVVPAPETALPPPAEADDGEDPR